MLNTIHVVFGDNWFCECRDKAEADKALALCSSEGIHAQYRETLPARFALVVEHHPKMAGRRDAEPAVRRHKWAYGEWQEGAPRGINEATGEMPDLFVAERQYKSTGAVTSYINEAQRRRSIANREIAPNGFMQSQQAHFAGVR